MQIEELEQELDDLLADIHQIIDEEPSVLPEEELPEDLFVSEPEPKPQPEPQEKPRAYWTQTQKLPKHVEKLQNHQDEAYARWLWEQENEEEARVPEEDTWETDEEMVEKRHHRLRKFALILLVLALAAAAAAAFLLPKQPVFAEDARVRRQGVSTVLLAGTDADGMRTDTLLLLCADRGGGTLSMVSIPRDTLVNGGYQVPKINTVYGANNGGAEGVEMLLTRVEECVGFRPDGYVLIAMEAFAELVDTLGGVEFDVPVDMYYNDPSQDLYIDLKAGPQKLSGKEALGVARYRAGYTDADLGRVQVQRQLMSALLDETVSVAGLAKAPQLMNVLLSHTDTDLSVENCLWLAETVLLADRGNIQSVTLPGSPRNLGGGSYYVLDPALVVQTVNTYCNPFETPLTAEDLNIRQG